MISVNIGIKTEIPKTENFKFLLFSLKLLIYLERMFAFGGTQVSVAYSSLCAYTSTFVCLYMNTPVSVDLGFM